LSPRREGRERRTLDSLAYASFPAPSRPPQDRAAPVAAMALRSLVVALKSLPRRMPGFGAFVPEGTPYISYQRDGSVKVLSRPP
ncbi:unnamed protein product, partial [Urochloa humidicola]